MSLSQWLRRWLGVNVMCEWMHRWASPEPYQRFIYPYAKTAERDQVEREEEEVIRKQILWVEKELNRIERIVEGRHV